MVCAEDRRRRRILEIDFDAGIYRAIKGTERTTMAWTYLMIAGALEIFWAVSLKYTDGFTRTLPSAITIAAMIVSMYLLALAARTLPIGTAYAVWVGIGAAGAVVLGITFLGESANPWRLFFLGLLLVSIFGLKITTP